MTLRTGRYGEFLFARKNDGERWVVGVWTAYADTAGETVADDMPYGLLWCLDGSGRDKPGVSTPLDRG